MTARSPSTHSSQYAAVLRAEAGDDGVDERLDDRLALVRPWRADHVADHVATRGQGGQHGVVDAADQRAQRSLAHDVELHALARRQAHRAVGQLGDPVERLPLLGGQPAARHGGADHARVVERELGRRPGPPDVTVVLLVDAVELEDHRVVVLERIGVGSQLLGQRAAQVGAGALDVLDAHRKAPWVRPTTCTSQSKPTYLINIVGVSVMSSLVRTFDYPVALDVTGVPVLVVGAGPVAARKVAGLAAAGAAGACRGARGVALSSIATPSPSCESGRIDPDDLEGVRLVVTATGRPEVDADVAADATAAGLWVNAADQPADCSFILPAVARNGPLSIAVSTGGTSPALAQRLRDRAGTLLTDEVVALAHELAERRAEVRAAGGSTEDVDWAAVIDAVLPPADDS